jgi:hypothetical protein
MKSSVIRRDDFKSTLTITTDNFDLAKDIRDLAYWSNEDKLGESLYHMLLALHKDGKSHAMKLWEVAQAYDINPNIVKVILSRCGDEMFHKNGEYDNYELNLCR